ERTIRYAVERKTAELELISYRDHLEDLVRERTAQLEERTRELERVNEKLHLEIVEREKTEEALRESEGKYRNLIDSSLDIVYTVRADGTISSLNPAFESVTG
ncbi:MAG: PAS domain S-box protein, partial [Syntrophobacteraceae bacterium]